MKGKFIRIDAKRIEELCRNKEGVMDTYFYRHKIIQELYWNRLEKMLNASGRFPAKTVLDLGCGQGVFLPSLSENYEDVHGIDLDISVAEQIIRLYNLSNVWLHQESILSNGFEKETFDLIYAPSVLEHFCDLNTLFSELLRIMKPGGMLIFSSPTETFLYEVGRKIFGAVKPEDHYHSVFEIQKEARKHLKYIRHVNGPFSSAPSFMSVYIIYVFVK